MTSIEASRRLAPEFAATRVGDDGLGRLSDRTWKSLVEGGFVRALQRARFGGGEVTLVEFIDVAMEISRTSPSAGWVAGVIGVQPWQLALFDEQAQQEMWGSDPTAMHSSSYNPTGKSEKGKGVTLGAIAGGRDIGGGAQAPDFRSFLLHREQYRIEDNWNVTRWDGAECLTHGRGHGTAAFARVEISVSVRSGSSARGHTRRRENRFEPG